jgi:transcriptional regulator with PAS, ATPase and Fis domain
MQHKLEYYEEELKNLRAARFNLDNLVGISPKMISLKKMIIKYAKINSPILITGETGTGKELCAHALHLCSERQNGPFIKINCAAIPHYLFESEFFGYERGAFTGANTSGKIGKFELANHGTILLDEISTLPLEMQPKLLRIIQDKEIERIGGSKVTKLDFKLISSTNRELSSLVKENTFREDLYYRLKVFNLELPPLRERKEDLPCLCEYFLKSFNEEFRFNVAKISEEVMNIFYRWHWPGNVRELRNVLLRAVHFSETGVIQIENLPDDLTGNPILKSRISETNPMGNLLKEGKNGYEKKLLESALIKADWNKSRAARLLGISRPHLYALARKYGLNE